MNRVERDFRAQIRRHGLDLVALTHTGSNHYRAQVRNAHGLTCIVIAPCSPSDHRGERNRDRVLRAFSLRSG